MSDLPIPDTAKPSVSFEVVEHERKPHHAEEWNVQWCPIHGQIPLGEEVAGSVSREGEGEEPWLCPDCLTYRETRTELLVVNLPAVAELEAECERYRSALIITASNLQRASQEALKFSRRSEPRSTSSAFNQLVESVEDIAIGAKMVPFYEDQDRKSSCEMTDRETESVEHRQSRKKS